jgi:antimicrobial peptide system SdpB family protein
VLSRPLRVLQVVLAVQLVATLLLARDAVVASASLPRPHSLLNTVSPYRLVSSQGHLGVLVIAATLVLAASGLWPRLLIPVQYWLTAWFPLSCISVVDGGDYIAALMVFELLPAVVLAQFAWSNRLSFFAVRAQIALVYLSSGITKLRVPEWRDGTALFSYARDPLDGLSTHLARVIATFGPVEHLLTWSIPVVEIALAASLLAPLRWRRVALGVGAALHVGIAVGFGLYTFAVVMIAGLVLLTAPWTKELRGAWEGVLDAPTDLAATLRAQVCGLRD